MTLRRIDTIDGARGVYDDERWVATFKRVEDLEEYLTLKTALAASSQRANQVGSDAERRVNALDGQAHLDELNARVRELEEELTVATRLLARLSPLAERGMRRP
jgi:hypothetical protein